MSDIMRMTRYEILIKTIVVLDKRTQMVHVKEMVGTSYKLIKDIVDERSDLIIKKDEGHRVFLSRTPKADRAAPSCKAFVKDYINDIEKYFIEKENLKFS